MKNATIITVLIILLSACGAGAPLEQNSDAALPDVNVSDCGNSTMDPGEECDTNNMNGLTCADFGYTGGVPSCIACIVDTSTCTNEEPVCGNGIVEPGEECDDGNQDNSDACPDGPGGTCQRAFCNDGFTQIATERCEIADRDGCYFDCSGWCGDGLVHDGVLYPDHGEECDGSANCTSECTITTCGDGYCTPSEENGGCVEDCECAGDSVECGDDCCEGATPGSAGACCGTEGCAVFTWYSPNGVQNCGSCGNHCAVGFVCVNGACTNP